MHNDQPVVCESHVIPCHVSCDTSDISSGKFLETGQKTQIGYTLSKGEEAKSIIVKNPGMPNVWRIVGHGPRLLDNKH